MSAPDLATLLQGAGTLPTLPQVVTHILETLNDDNADADSLVQRLNTDPVIVARLLDGLARGFRRGNLLGGARRFSLWLCGSLRLRRSLRHALRLKQRVHARGARWSFNPGHLPPRIARNRHRPTLRFHLRLCADSRRPKCFGGGGAGGVKIVLLWAYAGIIHSVFRRGCWSRLPRGIRNKRFVR